MTRIFKTLTFAAVIFSPALADAVDIIDPSAFYVDKDNPSASNSNDGSENSPWKTIQHGVNQLNAGQRLYVRESIDPYFEPNRASGSNWGGITINVSGTTANPIVIEGYPHERPVIDQQLAMSKYRAEDGSLDDPAASKITAGFFLFNANNITIKNFEITQTNASGVMFAADRHNDNVVVENMYIHNIYGGDNIGGIRLDRADNTVVRNNVIHDIYDTRRTENAYTSEPFGLHSGVHGYQPGNSIIENNLIYNVGRGVFQKAADSDGKNSNEVRRNVFYNIGHSAYSMEMQGSGSPPALNAKFYENIVFDAKGGVTSVLNETSGQSVGVEIYNNTFYNVDTVASLRGQTEIEFYNNILSGSNSVNVSANWTNSTEIENEIAYLDNNLYYDHADKWLLERFAPNFEEWTSLSSWQSAFSNDSGTGLITDPDVNSFEADPLFIDALNNDFRLENNSPAIGQGRAGETLGAYGLGAEVIGPLPTGALGDFDGDGDVDGADFLLWQRDGSVGSLSDWEDTFGASSPLGAARAVPEPISAALAVFVAMSLLARRRSLHRHDHKRSF